MTKVRRVDFYPDDFLVGVTGIKAPDVGVYWVVCSLIYSTGGPIAFTDPRPSTILATRIDYVQHSISRLVSLGKLWLRDGLVGNNRAINEIAKAKLRIGSAGTNGKLGGRPAKETNDLDKPAGFYSGSGTPKPEIPSARGSSSPPSSPSPTPSPNARDGRFDFAEAFTTIFERWPNDANRVQAQATLEGLMLRCASDADRSKLTIEILAGIERFRSSIDDPDGPVARTNLSGWLSKSRWLEHPRPSKTPGAKPNGTAGKRRSSRAGLINLSGRYGTPWKPEWTPEFGDQPDAAELHAARSRMLANIVAFADRTLAWNADWGSKPGNAEIVEARRLVGASAVPTGTIPAAELALSGAPDVRH